MIKIDTANESSYIKKALEKHNKYVQNKCSNNLQDIINSANGHEKSLYIYIQQNMEHIVKSLPDELEKIIEHIEEKYWIGTPKVNKVFKNAIKTKFKNVGLNNKKRYLTNIRNKLYNDLKSLYDYNSNPNHLLKDTVDEVNNIDMSAIFSIKELRNEIKQVKEAFECKNDKIHVNIKSVFNYKDFVSEKTDWNPYKLLAEVNIRVCPYCNRQYISIYDSNDGKTRPELDHFYPKSIYPYLGLAFYNLVPSCHICNSNLKGSIDTYKTHLNPYKHGYEDELKFSIKFDNTEEDISIIYNNPNGRQLKEDISYTDFLLGNSDEFDLNIIKNGNDDICDRGIKNIEDFKIVGLYKNHRDIIQHIIKKSIAYNESRINELFKEYEGTLFSSKEEVIQMLVSSYIDKSDFSKRALSKSIKDISQELGLLKYI